MKGWTRGTGIQLLNAIKNIEIFLFMVDVPVCQKHKPPFNNVLETPLKERL